VTKDIIGWKNSSNRGKKYFKILIIYLKAETEKLEENNKIGNVSAQPLWQWKINKYYILCVCVCVCVAVGIQHAMRMLHTVIYGLLASTIFFLHINGMIFEKECYKTKCLLRVSLQLLSEIKNVYWSSRKVPNYSCPILMKLEFSQQNIVKSINIKFNENSSNGSRVFLCGGRDGQTDLKLIFA